MCCRRPRLKREGGRGGGFGSRGCLIAVGVFSRTYFAPQGAKSGALKNATVCRLKFAVANFPRLTAGRLACAKRRQTVTRLRNRYRWLLARGMSPAFRARRGRIKPTVPRTSCAPLRARGKPSILLVARD